MANNTDTYRDKLHKGFFAFFISRFRVTILLVLLILFLWVYSLYTIPKESRPDIEFGIISITTVNQGLVPSEVDSLITEKIEREVQDIEGIQKITSQSQNSVSSITLELDTEVNTNEVLTEIKDAVDKAEIPSGAEDPNVQNISPPATEMFRMLMYTDPDSVSFARLMGMVVDIKQELESESYIESADISGGYDYTINVLLDRSKIEGMGLSLSDIASTIDAYNKNQSLGNFEIDDLNYDYRIVWEIQAVSDFATIPIISSNGTPVLLSDIASFQREFANDSVKRLGRANDGGKRYLEMSIKKTEGSSIFDASSKAKTKIETLLGKNKYNELSYTYAQDISQTIRDDYKSLSKNALLTFSLVFLAVLLFVGLREAAIALVALPLSFLITFFVLDTSDLTLNFLTNFSLIITLGIAIDTIVVIIEGGFLNMRLGFTPTTAILKAVRDLKAPLIAGTSTTLAAFVPLMMLPGVMGKFLAYIPITIFATLVSALFISLTINPALFARFKKNPKTYDINKNREDYLNLEDQALLKEERKGKTPSEGGHREGIRGRVFDAINNGYERFLEHFVPSRKKRMLAIFVPLLFMILSLVFISPRLGFTIFPQDDNEFLSFTVIGKEGQKTQTTAKEVAAIDRFLSTIREMDVYYLEASDNQIQGNMEIVNQEERERTSFEIQDEIVNFLKPLTGKGYQVESSIKSKWPPGSKAVGIELVASSKDQFQNLIQIAQDFTSKLKNIEGTKNVSRSAKDAPGEFRFTIDRQKLQSLGINPSQVYRELYAQTNGITATKYKGEIDDYDVKVKYAQFQDTATPDEILGLPLKTPQGEIQFGDVGSYTFDNTISKITRNDGRISIKVQSDLVKGYYGGPIMEEFLEYAKNYPFPKGVNYLRGWENEENAELINATISSFFVALMIIFTILVLQFNSYAQPLIILYSVVLGTLGINIGLWLTGNPYSMPFAIGFISMMGIVVNDAIILIDYINKNRSKGMPGVLAVSEAGKARLEPIMLTTVTTIAGVLPLAFEDAFWAGLSYTIVFGLFAASSMTLLVIPSLYYELFLRKEEKKWSNASGN